MYLLHTTSFATLEEVKYYKNFKYFTNGWVLEVAWKKYQEENTVLILGRVRHSFAASKAPLRPWVLVGSNGTILVAHCTCMAGLVETCSHVGAILHWVESCSNLRWHTMYLEREQMDDADTSQGYSLHGASRHWLNLLPLSIKAHVPPMLPQMLQQITEPRFYPHLILTDKIFSTRLH